MLNLFANKVVITESRSRRSRAYDRNVTNVYGKVYVDGYEVGTVWVNANGYYWEQGAKSRRVHGKLTNCTAKSVKGLSREIRKEFANLCAK